MKSAKRWVWLIVASVLLIQAAQTIYVIHRESLTWDEGDHMFAAYMMAKTGDYGLNPEHPPLVKLLAALPILGQRMWVPELQNRDFKIEAYLSGRDWVARNDGASNRIVFKMRLAAGLLAVAFTLMVFFAAREWFGDVAAVAAMTIAAFDPNVVGHSALVTTDIGVSLFFLASVYAFYRYVKQPSAARLIVVGLAAGLLLATKHSGVLLAPMLVLLMGWELATAAKGTRVKMALRFGGAFAAITVMAVLVLWCFYGWRYSARPAGLVMSTTLEDWVRPLPHFIFAAIMAVGHAHLLPESYLIGLVDVARMAAFYPTFIFGKVYAHGVWWYFPAVIAIKTTLGFLALLGCAVYAACAGVLKGKRRELAFLLLPAGCYLTIAILSSMDIGARHLLPVYTFAFILAGAGVMALAKSSKRWRWAGAVLIAAHIVSALSVFPNYIAYANEAWGGPKNVHNLLSDANADWAQQLFQVKAWQDKHPSEECYFAYFAYPEIDPATYGIGCKHLPSPDVWWLGGADAIPEEIKGNVYLSAGDLSGCEWPSSELNPYAGFQKLKPVDEIDYGVMVYQGTFEVKKASALSHGLSAYGLLQKGDKAGALAVAREGVATDPADIIAQTAHGDVAAAMGLKDEARSAWAAALASAKRLEPQAQSGFVPDLEEKLKK